MPTKIEWVRNIDGTPGETWNMIDGCSKISSGCDQCYAESIARRFAGTKAYPNGFNVTVHPERLTAPLKRRKPTTYFVNSMGDVFHQDVPDEVIAQMWAIMALTPQHTYIVLTKRHGRMRSYFNAVPEPDAGWQPGSKAMWNTWDAVDQLVRHHPDLALTDAQWAIANDPSACTWPLPNCWLGVSAENQQWADIRIPALLDTPAAVRIVSAEPLLGPVGLGRVIHQLDWLIDGGESGLRARPSHPDWFRSLRDQCDMAGVPYFHKQHGEHAEVADRPQVGDLWIALDGTTTPWHPGDGHCRTGLGPFTGGPYGSSVLIRRTGKKAAGRELDGRTHDDMPARHIPAQATP